MDDTFKRQVCFFNGYQTDLSATADSITGSPRRAGGRRAGASSHATDTKVRFKSISISFDDDANESVVKAIDTSLTPEAYTPEIRVQIPDKIDMLGQKARNDFCRAEHNDRMMSTV